MINILRMINKEKQLIDQELAKEDERLIFYRSFFGKNNCTTINGAIESNHCDLAIAILLNLIPELSVQEAKDVVYGNKDIFDNLNRETIEEVINLIDGFANEPKYYKKVKDIIYTEGTKSKIKNTFLKEAKTAEIIIRLTDLMETTPKSFFKLIDAVIKNSGQYVIALSTVSILREIQREKEIHYMMIQDIAEEQGTRVKNKIQSKWVYERINEDYNIKNLLQPIVDARNEYQSLEHNEKVTKRSLAKTKAIYETLETTLYKTITSGEVTNVESLIRKIPSDEIRIAILKLVYNHNQELYKKLTEEYQILSANDASHYQVLLAKYGISPEIYEVGTVMENSIEDLEKILKQLSKIKINDPEQILAIIQNTNLELVTIVYGLIDRGIITSDLLLKHQSIFAPNSQEYEDFMRNLDLINKNSINPHYFTETEEVFIIPHERLEQSIKTLEQYELLENIKTGMNLSFLKDKELPKAIDTLLELGYEKNLEECLELLNYKDKFDRLKIIKALNIELNDTASIIEVLSSEKFYVPDNQISDYIYNAVPYHLPKNIIEDEEPKKKLNDITRLSCFDNTQRTYSFNGVIISKNKVHRNLSHVLSTGNPQQRIIYGVLKDSTLSEEEVLKVVEALTPKKTTRVVNVKK